MSRTTFTRNVLRTLNSLSSRAGIRLLSTTEYDSLVRQPLIDRLRLESRQTAIAGALTAFAGYLTERDPLRAKSISIYELSGYLQHPETLSETVATIAQNRDEPIDRFMLYYAKHFRESNSQWSQDMFVSWTLGRCTKGTFLEMGGADGVTHSNTLSLEDHFHWRGTLIEPHPEQYRILSNTRGNRANRLMNCAATPASSEEALELIDAGQLSSLSNYIGRDLHQNNRTNSQRLHSVRAIPFQNILRDAGVLDYLSLDVEGPELALLNAIDWQRQSPPKTMTVEHNWRTEVISGIRETLGKAGYVEVFPEFDWLRRGDLWFSHTSALDNSDARTATAI